MAVFQWKGIQGEKYLDGTIEALNREEAAFKLKKDKVIITTLTKVAGKELGETTTSEKKSRFFFSTSVPTKEVLLFTKKCSTMIRAGLPVINTIEMLKNQTENKQFKQIVAEIHSDVESGTLLSSCFVKHPKIFDSIYVNLLKAGESSGKLDLFLDKLVISIEKSEKIKANIKSALFYPGILLTVALSVTSVMLIYVVPIFVNMFSAAGGALPLPTQIVVGTSDFLRNPMQGGILALVIFISVILSYMCVKKSYRIKKLFHRILLKTPIVGEMIIKSTVSKIAMIEGNLTAAGVSVLESLDIAGASVTNILVQEAMINVKRGVYSGEPLSSLYGKEWVFPAAFSQMVSVGEKTGNMEEMLDSISAYYGEEFDTTVQRMTSMLEPIMIVVMGITIGFIMISMYMPIFQMGKVVSG